MREYQRKRNGAAQKVAAPVLTWLREQYPDRQFDAFFSESALPDGPSSYSSTVCQIGPGLRRLVPKRVVRITDWGHVKQYARGSYDQSVLPQETLERLMEEVTIQDIRTIWKDELPPRPRSRVITWLEKMYTAASQ